MTQATSAGLWVSNPAAYRQRLFDLLGDRDPVEVLSQTGDVLEAIVRDHSASQLRSRPFDGKWTPLEIIGHLTDAEWVYGYRFRNVLCEDEPAMIGTRQEEWVSRQRYNERDPEELVAVFRGLRRLNLDFWSRLSPQDYERHGRHNERGLESLRTMQRMQAGHDLAHVDQIRRYLAAVGEQA